MNELINVSEDAQTKSDWFKLQYQSESNKTYLREEKLEKDYEFRHYLLIIFLASLSVVFVSKYFMHSEEMKLEREKFIYINKVKNDCDKN